MVSTFCSMIWSWRCRSDWTPHGKPTPKPRHPGPVALVLFGAPFKSHPKKGVPNEKPTPSPGKFHLGEWFGRSGRHLRSSACSRHRFTIDGEPGLLPNQKKLAAKVALLSLPQLGLCDSPTRVGSSTREKKEENKHGV